MIQKLPPFDTASVSEIIDIRKDLDGPLICFRSMVLSYAESIQSLPWDDDFEYECSLLYNKDVAPAIQEIDELSRENSFVRNLVGKIASDEKALKTMPGLIMECGGSRGYSVFCRCNFNRCRYIYDSGSRRRYFSHSKDSRSM